VVVVDASCLLSILDAFAFSHFVAYVDPNFLPSSSFGSDGIVIRVTKRD
jgi:hypothetical protein